MSITAGLITLLAALSNEIKLSATAATGGTAPYTYQWYRSVLSGFTPGGGNILAGKTALTLDDTGLVPGTTYFYQLVATDAVPASITYAQFTAVTPIIVPNINQFSQSPIVGMIDQRFDYNTTPVQIDVSQATPLQAGQAVKMVDSADGVPKVVACSADADDCMGFINFDIKTQLFNAGDRAEISQSGNVVYLMAATAIGRGKRVTLEVSTIGGVNQLVGASGANIVGWAFDKATAPGQIIRVKLLTPSYAVA